MAFNGLQAYFIAVGTVFLMLAGFLFYRRLLVVIQGITTLGRVEAYGVRTIDDTTSYLPVVAFLDSQGILRRFTSVAGSSDRNLKVGAEVTVRYLGSNPKVVYIVSFLHMWAAPTACFLFGVSAIAAVFGFGH